MHQNIPPELRVLKQWVASGSSKIPFNPKNGTVASPTDPSTWGSFEEALATGAQNIGFVLTRDDPYCIIDLDDKEDRPASDAEKARFQQMMQFFDTYQEVSTSGRGVHIVLKGSVPSGVHRDHIEIYSEARYMIFTGNVIKNVPIADGYQPTLDAMYGQMHVEASIDLVEREEIVDDDEIYQMAANAANADKFNSLCSGDLADYPSQSEADLALLSILAYYTQSDEQVRRLFRATALGQREKAQKNDTYINYALRKIRAKQPPPVDLTAILANANSILGLNNDALPMPIPPAPAPLPVQQISQLTLPPGLVGEVAQYVYASSIRPVPEIALATAIAFVAGIAGRAYNTSTRAGLSQYIALLAKTGTGKEAAASGISRLLMAIRTKIPAAMDFMGPAVFASGPALHRTLSVRPCFVSVLGEFGLLMKKLTDPRANMADVTLQRLMLDIYGKSGHDNLLNMSVYSDKEKDVASIQAPNVTILGESTPESFYNSLDQSAVTSGFLPRFFVIEYFGERPERNPNPHVQPSEGLLNRVAELVTLALQAQANNTCMPVMNDSHAQQTLDDFDRECDGRIRGQNDVLGEIWNRAHLKALKLSALIAVGCNPYQPVVTKQIATWAVDMIRGDSTRLSQRFQAGDVGEGDGKQQSEIARLIEAYAKGSPADAAKYNSTPALHSAKAISYKYLLKRTYSLSAFKHDKRGSTEALNKALTAMVDSGQLIEIDRKTLTERFMFNGRAFGIGGNWG
jgi:hypothetical protein